ncbi:hypothetical protein [Janthinobacterium fluminis]|uniref:Uncharacterized protein n=1 Tax=Janthinobacterium fluminis TaxID=2987524 RepID=A0ABT5JZ18_9BURK|nr:hypothetical protein [Janthinobacterium fluminis]MDC8757967.1 hypothetical protein [Janthinobacterium fluminis]
MRHWPLFAVLAAAAHLAAAAPEPPPAPEPGAGCVEVEVNGVRTQSLSCLSEKLLPAPAKARPAPPQAGMAAEAIAQRPSNQLGLFNWSATSHRMGNTFGTSVQAQRPAPPPAAPVLPRRP